VILSHRIQLDPTAKQAIYFSKACGTSRLCWNWALAEWNEQYEVGGKPKAVDLKRYWNAVKYIKFPWLKDIHRDAHSQPFANLHSAFSRFFKGEAKRPKFKKKGKSRDSFYVANDKFRIDGQRVTLPVVGSVRMTEALRFEGKIQSAVVSRDADRWFVSIAVEVPETPVAKPTGDPIGVDLGLKTFAALSTGEKIDAPKPLAASIKRLRRLSRHHSRKVIGSSNRRKAAMRLARHHRRVRNIRKDFLNKTTTRLAKNHSQIAIEDLAVSNMVRNRCLSRAISDVAWSETRRQLDYKTRLYGSELTVRDRFFASSKTCSNCGHKMEILPLSIRDWACPSCDAIHDRDVNAAKNLVRKDSEGYSQIYACGDRSSGLPVMAGETTVVEAGTSSVRTRVRSHRR
jgi:putative transposase